MKRISLLLAVLALMSMAAMTALAAPKKVAPPPEKAKPLQALPQPYAWMRTELALVEDQQNKIAELFKNANVQKITNELLKVENDKIVEAKKELAAATKEKNADDVKAARTKIAEAEAAKTKVRFKVRDKLEGEIMTILTADQKTKWAIRAALPDVRTGLRPVTLTNEQVGKVRALVEAQSTALLGAWGSEKIEEWKGVIKGILDEVKGNILSEQQQKMLPKEETPPAGGAK